MLIETLIEAVKHSPEQAEQCSLIVHYNGKCTVKTGEYTDLKPRCSRLLQAGLMPKSYNSFHRAPYNPTQQAISPNMPPYFMVMAKNIFTFHYIFIFFAFRLLKRHVL